MTRYVTAVLLGAAGFIHADLYLHGYRAIPLVGPAFLLQASGSFAIAALLLAGDVLILRLAAAGLAAGALGGFVLSRTIGIGGFVERGFDPAPQALISVLLEVGVLVLLATPVLSRRLRARPELAGR
ncbi:hypothetical protein [Kutzneria kofuensis]|uniref:DUF4345 domain-containing protein n=1 Tax=Kutzneria kofuensis TaxID=103725 RepID=A0A7W9KBX4_9PSEU|nr:hypothetical protein [Kutzneria kofuensis]MBB5889785.1 hypothetical protein [Kutzneria kofuensis]